MFLVTRYGIVTGVYKRWNTFARQRERIEGDGPLAKS